MLIQKIKDELLAQKKSDFKGNIYHWTQVNFAFNSNKIEGSRLSAEQTEMIFETNSFITKGTESVRTDDLIEAINHFKMFDYMLEHIDEPISKQMMIDMNMLLKRNTTDENDPRYNVGGFKTVPNIIGLVNVIKTTPPEQVETELDVLLSDYMSKDQIALNDIVDFHVRFERIHPFGDGNGRVGRMLMFKECLKNDIMPFIVLDQDKNFYLRGLKEYDNEPNYLVETCMHEQDIYENLSEQLLDFDLDMQKENTMKLS